MDLYKTCVGAAKQAVTKLVLVVWLGWVGLGCVALSSSPAATLHCRPSRHTCNVICCHDDNRGAGGGGRGEEGGYALVCRLVNSLLLE